MALLFIAGTVGAQITDRGNFIIGGTLGFSTASSNVEQNLSGENTAFEGSTSTQFNIAPSIGYFLVRNFAVGVGMDYTFNAVEDPDGSMEDDSDLLFGPFMRLYLPISDDMSFFLESTAGFGSSSNTSTIDGANQNISTDVFAFGVGPGFTIFSSNAVGIEALVKY
ncbi:MAG: outer membrane beta-barrel protein, partial [Phaeodactylibacter sp.]|nr:outer membrane beta-barrel protein [Phaeodactylibacter sp.]